MRGRGVKERLKGKDSLREKRLSECQTEKKKLGAAEGGRDTKGGRDKENKRGEGESDRGRREIQREGEREKMLKRNERDEMRKERYQGTELQGGEMEGEKKML